MRAVALAALAVLWSAPAMADPVSIIGLIGSIAGAAAASSPGIIAAIGATAAAVLGAVISVGSAVLAQMLISSRNQNTGGQREERTRQFDPHPPLRFAFGEFPLEGSVVFHHAEGQVYYMTLLLNSVPSDSVSVIEINDGIELEFDLASGSDIYDMAAGAECSAPSPFAGAVKMWIGLGEQSGPPAQWLSEIPNVIEDTDAWAGATVAHVRIAHGNQKVAVKRWTHGKPPPFRFLGRWSKVYDPRLDSSSGVTGAAGDQDRDDRTTWEWSDSPALCALMLVRHEYGLGFDDEMIPIQQWADAADGIGPDALGREKTFVMGDTFGALRAVGVTSNEVRWTYAPSGGGEITWTAYDSAKNVYVGDDNGRLARVAPGGAEDWSASAHSGAVVGIELAADGTVYSAGADGFVRIRDASGTLTGSIDAGAAINGLAFDGTDLFVTINGNKVRKYQTDGTQLWEYTAGNFCLAVAADGTGGCFVISGNIGPFFRLSDTGALVWATGTIFDTGLGQIALGSDGTAWYADATAIRGYSAAGALVASIAHGVGIRVRSLTVDPTSGDIYAGWDQQIRRYTTGGTLVQTLAREHPGDTNRIAISSGADATGWFGCDGLVIIEERELSLLDPVLACMAGHLDTTDGLLGVRAGVWSEPTGALSQPVGEEIAVNGARDAGFDTVRAKFLGRHRNWEETDGPGWTLRSGARVHPLHLPLVKEPEQAARLEKVFALRAEPMRTVRAVWDGREANRRVGERVTFALPGFARAASTFVIDSKQVHMEPVQDGLRLEVEMTLVEDLEATYAWSEADYAEPEDYAPPGIATPSIAPPTNLELATAFRTWGLGEEGEPVPQIRVRFRPSPAEVDFYRVEIYEPAYTIGDEDLGDRTWSVAVDPESTIDDGGVVKLEHLVEPVRVGLTYTIKVWSVSYTLGESDTWLEGDITVGAPDSGMAAPVLVASDHDGDHTATHTIRAPNSGAVRAIRLYVDDSAGRSGLSLLQELFVGSLQATDFTDALSYAPTRYYTAVAVDRFGSEGDALEFDFTPGSGAATRDYSTDYSPDYG